MWCIKEFEIFHWTEILYLAVCVLKRFDSRVQLSTVTYYNIRTKQMISIPKHRSFFFFLFLFFFFTRIHSFQSVDRISPFDFESKTTLFFFFYLWHLLRSFSHHIIMFSSTCALPSSLLFVYLFTELENTFRGSINGRADLQDRLTTVTDRLWKEPNERIRIHLGHRCYAISVRRTRLEKLFTPNRSGRLSSRWKLPYK